MRVIEGIRQIIRIVDMEVTSSSVSSVVEPQSVPSRISVVLVEEAKVRGPSVWFLHVWIRIHDCWPDAVPSDGILFLAVPPGIPFPVGPVGPYGMLSPSDTAAVGPVGPDGTLSSSDLAGILVPAIPAGIPSPVGPYGTLSPSGGVHRPGGGGGGFTARISSKVRPQDPWGGATWIAATQGVVDMEVTSSSVSSVVEPQSVPSRISVVLVEEAKVRGTECLVPPRVDKDPRLLAGVASPASVTVDKVSKISPCVVGTLFPSDSDSVGPVGPCGTLSPSDSDAVGPV